MLCIHAMMLEARMQGPAVAPRPILRGSQSIRMGHPSPTPSDPWQGGSCALLHHLPIAPAVSSPPNSQGLTVRGQNVTVSQFDSKPIHQALEGGRN